MILLVDDEKRWAELYREILEEELPQHEVQLKDKVDEALALLRRDTAQIELLILDIMMSPGRTFRDVDTRNGLRTGHHFFNLVRTEIPDLPVVILTNVSDLDEEEYYEGQPKCWFFRKEDCTPFELSERIRNILDGVAA
jgi:CheY-like chemotaxis protein